MRRPAPSSPARVGRAPAGHHLPGQAPHPPQRPGGGLVHVPAGLLHQVARVGPLESPWVAAGFGALLVASVAVVVRQRRRRPPGRLRHRWLRRGALAAWLAGLVTLGGLAGVNSYVGYVPTLPGLLGDLARPGLGGRGRGSQVLTLRVGAAELGVPPDRVYVYLPPGYGAAADARRRYPVVYLLHGYPGGPEDWFRAARVQRTMDAMLADGLVQPMILAAPDANGGWLHDSEMLDQVGGPQVQRYLVGPVVRAVDARFRTLADRAGRAIAGMSSGGYGALNLGLRHQGVYSVVVSLMPYGDPGARAVGLLGGSRALWLANAPDAYLPTMAFHHRVTVGLLAGSRDPERAEARRLAGMLRARGQVAVFTEVPGATHTWRGARLEAPYLLAFASAHLTGSRPARVRPVAAGPGRRPPGAPAGLLRRRRVSA